MDILSIIIIGIGLAMDCFAVSVSKGVCAKKFFFWHTFRMAFLFGLFQSVMPLIGFFAGGSFLKQIKDYDHWIAFILLSAIGIKMIYEGVIQKDPDCVTTPNPFKLKSLLVLALATSIDALATGIVFISFPDIIWIAVILIGGISFLFTFIGMYIGIHFGKRFHINVELLGGLILIGIGTKILIEHLGS